MRTLSPDHDRVDHDVAQEVLRRITDLEVRFAQLEAKQAHDPDDDELPLRPAILDRCPCMIPSHLPARLTSLRCSRRVMMQMMTVIWSHPRHLLLVIRAASSCGSSAP